MAQEAPVIRNKGLLIAAVTLGVLAIIIYNWQIRSARQKGVGETVFVVELRQNLAANTEIDRKAIEIRQLETHFVRSLGNVIVLNDGEPDLKNVVGRTVNQDVQRGEYLRWDQITGNPSARTASAAIEKGMVAFPIAVDPVTSPGTILSRGDRVTILGKLRLKKDGKYSPLQSYAIIERVPVLAIGGIASRSETGLGRRRIGRAGMRTYRSIAIMGTPKTATELDNVLTHVAGSLTVVVCSPEDRGRRLEKARVHESLRGLLALEVGRGTLRRSEGK